MLKRAAEEPPPSSEIRKVGQDVFSFYRSQVAEFLAQEQKTPDQDLAANETLSNEIIGPKISKLGREKLIELLQQCARDLYPEIDEMLPRLHSLYLMSHLDNKTSPSKAEDIINKDPTYKEVKDDIQAVLASNQDLVKELNTQHSNRIRNRLAKMKQELEEIADNVVATCRPMTLSEKNDLQKSIKELPQKHFARVAEIIKNHGISLGNEVSSEVLANMEKDKGNIVLWRVRIYVAKVKSGRKFGGYASKK